LEVQCQPQLHYYIGKETDGESFRSGASDAGVSDLTQSVMQINCRKGNIIMDKKSIDLIRQSA
jgi:hypothetical protein